MIKNKRYLILSALLFLICMTLYFPFPDNEMIAADMTFMSFPIHDQNGYHPLAFFGSAMMIVAIVFLVKSLSKYHIRTVLLTLVVYSFLPIMLITFYQETIGTGIHAVSYDGQGTCDFEGVTEVELRGKCELKLENHSGKPVTFDLVFRDTYYPEFHRKITSLMNINGPYTITLEANSEKVIQLNELLNVSNEPEAIANGGSQYIRITLIEGEKSRKM
ncbi:hypothetical protein [Bacillus sp. KH172YL63]|uniref:hypothetical protein n=1 Tax=Bacillus sp. KH172YL63 TaxID=2709784 RepID=UPI0013E41698|nr:hypothetical protein [Bacillus sp. KH172YL63]BCB03983.1 hypothetical protein KH172YL63_21160 [Bacillus sp. KH172YL63]